MCCIGVIADDYTHVHFCSQQKYAFAYLMTLIRYRIPPS